MTESHPPGAETAPVETPMPEATSGGHRLTRRTDRRMIAGVCAGLASHFGLDVALVRVAFVLLAVFSGIGLVVYIAAWLLVPPSHGGEDAPHIRLVGAGPWIGVSLIVLAIVILGDELRVLRPGIIWPLLLIGIGVALWTGAFPGRTSRAAKEPATPFVPASDIRQEPEAGSIDAGEDPEALPSDAGTPPSGTGSTSGDVPGPDETGSWDLPPAVPPPPSTAEIPQPPVPPPPPRPRKPPSPLGRITMGAVVVALGVGILLDSANVVDVSVRTLLSICLLITGAGLLVGTWWGRGRWLVFPGMLLVVALLGINFASVHGMDGRRQREFNFRVGNQSFTPTTPQDLQSEYRILGGEMTLDLSGLDLQGQRPRVEAGLGFGQLSVVVPPDTGLRIEARVGAGEIDLLGKHDDGMGIVSTHRTDPTDRGLLTLRLSVGTGQISVREGVQPFQPLIPSPPPAFTDAPPAPEGTP